MGCCQADSPLVCLGDVSFESCTASFGMCLRSLPFCEGTTPETSFCQPMLHDVSLVDVQTSRFSIASASAIAAGELTPGNTTRTSFALLGPSQGLADTVRKVRSTRSVAFGRLSVRTLCLWPRGAHHSGRTHPGRFRPPILVQLLPRSS